MRKGSHPFFPALLLNIYFWFCFLHDPSLSNPVPGFQIAANPLLIQKMAQFCITICGCLSLLTQNTSSDHNRFESLCPSETLFGGGKYWKGSQRTLLLCSGFLQIKKLNPVSETFIDCDYLSDDGNGGGVVMKRLKNYECSIQTGFAIFSFERKKVAFTTKSDTLLPCLAN